MTEYYATKLLLLSTSAYTYASDVNANLQKRVSCLKFLHSICPHLISLSYEGNKKQISYVIYKLICLIKIRSNSLIAAKELINFYPELENEDWVQEAIDSSMFDLTNQK